MDVDKLKPQFSIVWAVRYSDYFPMRIDSLWATKQAAEAVAEEMGPPWHAQPVTVNEREEE